MATTAQHSEFDQVKRWVQDRPAISPKTQDSLLGMAGGTAVVIGSLMPWISFNSAGAEVKPGAKAASVVLGLVIVATGFALRAALLPGRLVAGVATLCLSSLAGLLYVGFIPGGLGGVPRAGRVRCYHHPDVRPEYRHHSRSRWLRSRFRRGNHVVSPPPGLTAIHAHHREKEQQRPPKNHDNKCEPSHSSWP